jgi:hypothetical protein
MQRQQPRDDGIDRRHVRDSIPDRLNARMTVTRWPAPLRRRFEAASPPLPPAAAQQQQAASW